MIPTLIATELSTAEIVLAVLGLIFGSSVLSTAATLFATRKKIRADVHKTDAEAVAEQTKTILEMSREFRIVLKEVQAAIRETASSEEQRMLDRIASQDRIEELEALVSKFEQEHIEWSQKQGDWEKSRADMLAFLITIEPELKAISAKATVIEAVQSLRKQIENT